jgi:hypothetical protein
MKNYADILLKPLSPYKLKSFALLILSDLIAANGPYHSSDLFSVDIFQSVFILQAVHRLVNTSLIIHNVKLSSVKTKASWKSI